MLEPMWFEVPKSKRAPKAVRKALEAGADLVFVWGGDGMVQRSIDVLAGSDATVAILPAGTANVFATNLGIPKDLAVAVEIGLHGARRQFDVGSINGEHFAVMAGAGFDALMIRDAGGILKDRMGRAAYIWTGAKNLRAAARPHPHPGRRRQVVHGQHELRAGGERRDADGRAHGVPGGGARRRRAGDRRRHCVRGAGSGSVRWRAPRRAKRRSRRSCAGRAGTKFDIRFAEKTAYELDGGDRKPKARLRVKVHPNAITVCVPEQTQ